MYRELTLTQPFKLKQKLTLKFIKWILIAY